MAYTRTAAQSPLPVVSTTVYTLAAALATVGGTAPAASRFAPGMVDGNSARLNRNGTYLDILAMAGGGTIRAVLNRGASDTTLAITYLGSNNIKVNAGQAFIDGLVELTTDASGIAVSAGWNYVWLNQAGTITVQPGTIAPPNAMSVFIGAVNVVSGTGTVDYSGVVYTASGFRVRYTGDAAAPTDTPPTGARGLVTITNNATYLYFWDGTAHRSMGGAPTQISVMGSDGMLLSGPYLKLPGATFTVESGTGALILTSIDAGP